MAEPKFPMPVSLADDGDHHVTSGTFVRRVAIPDADGWVREIKATFTNRAELRMTLAETYQHGREEPFTLEASAGPTWT